MIAARMCFDRLRAQAEARRDLLRRASFGDELQDLALAWRDDEKRLVVLRQHRAPSSWNALTREPTKRVQDTARLSDSMQRPTLHRQFALG